MRRAASATRTVQANRGREILHNRLWHHEVAPSCQPAERLVQLAPTARYRRRGAAHSSRCVDEHGGGRWWSSGGAAATVGRRGSAVSLGVHGAHRLKALTAAHPRRRRRRLCGRCTTTPRTVDEDPTYTCVCMRVYEAHRRCSLSGGTWAGRAAACRVERWRLSHVARRPCAGGLACRRRARGRRAHAAGPQPEVGVTCGEVGSSSSGVGRLHPHA